MIARYSRLEMSKIWSEEEKLSLWLEIELLALEGMVGCGLAPAEAAEVARSKAAYSLERVQRIEVEVKHDVIAFVSDVAAQIGPLGRYLHRGLTSSDLIDTAFAVQLTRASDLILQGCELVLAVIKARAYEFKLTPCVGRSHGVHAEPITFGLKLAGWYAEFSRGRERLRAARAMIAVGKISGPVGTYAALPPAVEAHVLARLGLHGETVATQIVARDRHAHFFQTLALLASSIERCCVEIRHLQRSEVREVAEPFASGQKGSSAMPHKRNPVLAENLSGLARLVRGYSHASEENVALWHERDISHSSVERVVAPDACLLIDFMLARFAEIVQGLEVYPARMKENLEAHGGVIHSGALLLALTDKGFERDRAYRIVQGHALAAFDGGPSLAERAAEDPEIKKVMTPEALREVFDTSRHFRHLDTIFARTFK